MSESLLLKLARESITEVFEAQNIIDKEALLAEYPVLNEPVASFVTLYLDNELRGSAGSIIPSKPLIDDIIYNAKKAAFEDKRFAPLKTSEYLQSQVELSLLTPPIQVYYDSIEQLQEQIVIGEDGVILTYEDKQAAFLPQIWSQLKDFDSFFQHLLHEAGLGRDGLKLHPDIHTFKVEKQIDEPILS